MLSIDQLKQDSYKKLEPVFGSRESLALIRALQEDLYEQPKFKFNGDELVIWNEAIQRLLENEPVAYITGKVYFLNLNLRVNRRVLIPRPETEALTIEAIQFLKANNSARVIDMGTGSGCIALAIKSAIPWSTVYALDVEGLVLNVVLENALNHKLDISCIQSDILDERSWKDLPGDLDVIISNPPYIQESEKNLMSSSVLQYEPPLALFAGPDPLLFYKAIARFSKTHLKPKGRILVEINEFLAKETLEVFEMEGYSRPELISDLNGKDRIISVMKY